MEQSKNSRLIAQAYKGLKKKGKLKIQGKPGPMPKSWKKFILNFFRDYNMDYETVHTKAGKYGNFQCESGCNRSIGDLYRIVSFYYPTVTLRKIYNYMYKSKEARYHLGGIWCPDIEKRVFYYCESKPDENYDDKYCIAGWAANPEQDDDGNTDYPTDEYGVNVYKLLNSNK